MTARVTPFSASIGCFCKDLFGENRNIDFIDEAEENLDPLLTLTPDLAGAYTNIL